MAASEQPDAIASFLWASPPPKLTPSRSTSSVTERFETVLSADAVSQLVGGLTEKLKNLEEAKLREERRRQSLLSELSDTRTQLAITRSQLLRLELIAGLFVVARLLTSSSVISSSVSTLTETSTSICRDVFDWVMVWMGGCSLIEALIGIILVSQLVYLLVLDDMDPFATSSSSPIDEEVSSGGGNASSSKSGASLSSSTDSGGTSGASSKLSLGSGGGSNKIGSLAGSDDLKSFIPKDADTAINKMHDCSSLWTQPPTFQDKNGLAVWHRPIGAAVHEFKFTVDINSEPAPVFAMAREVELMSSWNPFISTGLTLHYSPPPNCSIRAYLQIQLPWPLPKFAVVVTGKLFDCLDHKEKCLVVVLGSEKEDGAAPEGLRPPSTPQEIRRLWVRVIAKAKPVRTCTRNTPLHVTAGSSSETTPKKGGWFGGGGGAKNGGGDDPSKPKTYFEVIAKLKFPIPAPGWVIRFIISTLAPLIVSKVQELLPTLMEESSQANANAAAASSTAASGSTESFPSRMNKDRSLYGSILTDKVRRAVPPTVNT